LTLFGCCNMQTKFRNKCYLNKNLFFTISREIHNRGTWVQAHCCFLIFSYIPILFLEKNRFYENFEISWAIDFAVFAFWLFNTVQRLQIIKSDALHKRNENEVELVIIAIANIKVMHHTNVGISGTIRRNLQRTTISYKHIQLHMEKNSFYKVNVDASNQQHNQRSAAIDIQVSKCSSTKGGNSA
ncbi:hypothetical protein T05_14194, partial [Trichinella murrelli]